MSDDGSRGTNSDGTVAGNGTSFRRHLARVGGRLEAIRSDDRRRRRALAVAIAVGLALAWVHWTGLVLAGVLVGLTRSSGRKAVAAGFALGVLAVLGTVVLTPAMSAGEFAGLTPVNYLTVGAGFVLPVWGSLARFVV